MLVPLRVEEVSLGMTLPWRVFNEAKDELMAKGARIETEEQLRLLLDCKPLREDIPEAAPPAAAADEISFEQIDLRPGSRMQIEVGDHVRRQKHWTRMIGYLPERGLLITHPHVGGFPVPLAQGATVLMRAFSNQRAYSFSCWLKNICRVPFEYLFLSYPSDITGVTVRNSPRVKVHIPVAIQRTDAPAGAAWFSDLSESGALLESHAPVGAVSDKLELAFDLVLDAETINLKLIASIKALHSGKPAPGQQQGAERYGVQFVDLDQADRLKLRVFVYESLLYNPLARA